MDWIITHRISILILLVVIAIFFLIYFVVQNAGIKVKNMSIDNFFQMLTLIVLTITAVILFLNLVYFYKQFGEVKEQTKSLQDQISLTKILNRPICAVKNVEISKPSEDEYHISITVMNFGQYIAKDISFNWMCSSAKVKRKNDERFPFSETLVYQSTKRPKSITLLPHHEFEEGFYIHKSKVKKVLEEDEGVFIVSANLEYQGIDETAEKYACKYSIGKPKTLTGAIHVHLQTSKFETF